MRFSISIAFACLASVYAIDTDVLVPDPPAMTGWYLVGRGIPDIVVRAVNDNRRKTRFGLATATLTGYVVAGHGYVPLNAYETFTSLNKYKSTGVYTLDIPVDENGMENFNERKLLIAKTQPIQFTCPGNRRGPNDFTAIYVHKGESLLINEPIIGLLQKLEHEAGHYKLVPWPPKKCFDCLGGSGSN